MICFGNVDRLWREGMEMMEPAENADKKATSPVSREWNWHPDTPISMSPLFQWPVRMMDVLRWFAASWLRVSTLTFWLFLSIVIWTILHPGLETAKVIEWSWVGQTYVRNIVLMLFVAGSLHFYFYVAGAQGTDNKFDARVLARENQRYTFRDQVLDNMFWSLGSGVVVWTAYEVICIWAIANDMIPVLAWAENPFWFVCLFVLIPLWSSMHFYWVHRFLHWAPVYRHVHALHHRNINIGPWSGLSMHPVEHLLYFSTLAIHFFVPTHPVHILFHLYLQALNPLCSHSGFAFLLVGKRHRLALGDFFHQLHHRCFECNYGTIDMPWDMWFGTFHDGTEESGLRVRNRQREKRKVPETAG